MADEDRAELGVELTSTPMTPLADEAGGPRSRIAPYLPVLDACSVCPARCCRLNVEVSIPDAIRFCTTLSVPLFAGMTVVAKEAGTDHAFRLDRDPRVVGEDEPWTGWGQLQLRRREDGACHALAEVGGYQRCGVYAARPSFCRTYPATWTSRVARGGPEAVLCPVAYGIDPAHERELVAQVEESIRFWELHDRLAAEWNASDGPHELEAFFEGAVASAAEVMGVDARVVLASGQPDQRLYDEMVRTRITTPPAVSIAHRAPRGFAGLPPRS